jgi:hypothetical protein
LQQPFQPNPSRRSAEAVRDKDGAALEAAMVKVVHGVVDGVQRVYAGMQVYLAGGRQRHEFDEFVVGADEVTDDVALG